MIHTGIVTENQLDEWVRGNARIAQGVIVELVWRLVGVSSPMPKMIRFPLGDSIEQPGPDGLLEAGSGFDPFVPVGKSYWEIGTGVKPREKATSDYKNLVEDIPELTRRDSTFIFVTPLSGRRVFSNTWKEGGQASWLEDRKKRSDWKDVRIIDGTTLIEWLHQFPAIACWLACKMGIPMPVIQRIQTLEQHWSNLKSVGSPPLTPQVFLENRSQACDGMNKFLSEKNAELNLITRYPDHVADFVAAYVANLDDNLKMDMFGRCLVISSVDAWGAMSSLQDQHILVADFNICEAGDSKMSLIEEARKNQHSVIYGKTPGGISRPNSALLLNPKSYQITEALKKAGYPEERARNLATKSGGNLSALLRCLQSRSPSPRWAEESSGVDLAIAQLLGAWDENSEADKKIVETMSGKPYGDWIVIIREIKNRPGSPLVQRNGIWKFVERYEGWDILAPKLFDEHIERFCKLAIEVLREKDPKFGLAPDERFMANAYGKITNHSPALRREMAESLAIIGSYPKALSSCSLRKGENVAESAVHEILSDADWILWASFGHQLLLLAEAAPGVFLDAVESSLNSNPCPFDKIFAQETSGLTGDNYMAYLLWALEALAWDPNLLIRVVVILGNLTDRDPGGKSGNRPGNSLSTILLPWLPQTCAPVEKREVAVRTLLHEFPKVGWNLLLALLPQLTSHSMGSHKPMWRQIIPDDWPSRPTRGEYRDQVESYSAVAIDIAMGDVSRLVNLVDHLRKLPPPALERILDYLESDALDFFSQADRSRLGNKLSELAAIHKKHAGADWVLQPEEIERISEISKKITPSSPSERRKNLFTEQERDLYDGEGSFEEQRARLCAKREEAVFQIFQMGGIEEILKFSKSVASPGKVGYAFKCGRGKDISGRIFPDLLNTSDKSLAGFTAGYICGSFKTGGWPWVETLDMSQWAPEQIGQFLICLPFTEEVCQRASRLLGRDESIFWTRTSADPYSYEGDFNFAVDRLIDHDRPDLAILLLYRMMDDNQPLDPQRVAKALLETASSLKISHGYEIVKLIRSLQENEETNPDDLFLVEWTYLSMLDIHYGAYPKFLGQKLANESNFYCEIIQLLFKSNKEEISVETDSKVDERIRRNGYELLEKWRTPPGTSKNGRFNDEVMSNWLAEVRGACEISGHMKMALYVAGRVLFYAPRDPNGLWIRRSVANVLNAPDAESMRKGFCLEIQNSRGVYMVTGGQEERKLAEKYQNQAEEVENHGYSRLAVALRKLASTYERDAEHYEEREMSGDDY